MSLLAYALTASALLRICHRAVHPLSRIAAALLFLLPFCFVGRALLTDAVYAPIDIPYATEPLLPMRGQYGIDGQHNGILSDISSQMIPWRKAVQWAYSHGVWPVYNPFILSGDILAASAQPAAYSPFTLIAILLPVAKSFTYTAAIAFFVAALGTFLFARELGCREVAALIGSAVFMYSTAISFMVLWPLAFTWTLLPFVLLGVHRVVREPGARSMFILTAAFALMLLAGHPETALHIVAIGGAYAVFELVRAGRTAAKAIAVGVAAGVLSLLICAIYLLPIIDAVGQTIEHHYRSTYYADAPRGSSFEEGLARVATDVFPFLHIRRWLVPEVMEVPVSSAAVGSIALAIAIYAVWRHRSPYTWFFVGVALFGLLARADWPFVARAFQKLPLFDITINDRFSFASAFALAILAAIGVETWLVRDRDLGLPVTFLVVLCFLTFGTLWIERAGVVGPNIERWGDYKVFAELGLLAVATLIVLPRVPSRYAAPLLLGIVLLNRTMSEGGSHPSYPAESAYPPVPIFDALKNVERPFRVTGIFLTFLPSMNALYELEDVRAYQAMTLAPYAGTYRLWCTPQPVWFNRVDDLAKPFLSFLNVRFAVVWGKFPLPEGWKEFARQRGSRLIENTRVIERAYVPRWVRLGFTDPDVLNQMAEETDFRERAWVAAPLDPHQRANGPGRVTTRRMPQGYELEVEMEGDGWVVVSESFWKGWRGYLDGRRVRLQTANTAFLSIFVPRGKHHVRLVYLPDSFVRGRAITFATLAGILFWSAAASLPLLKRRLRRRTPK